MSKSTPIWLYSYAAEAWEPMGELHGENQAAQFAALKEMFPGLSLKLSERRPVKAPTLGPMVLGDDGTVNQNPLVRVKVGSPSQRPRKTKAGGSTLKASPRLKSRRAKTAKTKTRGVWANPADEKPYVVQVSPDKERWIDKQRFSFKKHAMDRAYEMREELPGYYIRVFDVRTKFQKK